MTVAARQLRPPRPLSETLRDIESSLESLWANDSPDQAQAHAYTMNLIAVRGQGQKREFLELIEEVSAQLASRTTIVDVDPELDAWAFNGDVSAVCRVQPGESRPSVCAERLELSMGASTAKRIRSILVPLLEAQLPTVLYVGLGAPASVVGAIARTADRIVLDSALYGLSRSAQLAANTDACVHDLAFTRVRHFREMLARFFDDPRLLPALSAIRSLEVSYVPTPDAAWPSAQAELLISWLGVTLGWQAELGELFEASGLQLDVTLTPCSRREAEAGSLETLTLEAELDEAPVVARIERADDGSHLLCSLDAFGEARPSHQFLVRHRRLEELVTHAVSDVVTDPLVGRVLRFAHDWARTP